MIFAKPQQKNNTEYREVINDINNNLVTMYRMGKLYPDELLRLIEATPYSQSEHKRAGEIYKNPQKYSELEIAWATFIQCNCSFANMIGAGWGLGRISRNSSASYFNHLERLPKILDRLKYVHISCEDAIRCIKRCDSPETFFYCDPPYINADQGHYKGYTPNDFNTLVETLRNIQGSMILSCYPQENMPQEWERIEFKAVMSASNKKDVCRERTECIWIKKTDVADEIGQLKMF
jgi:DNA adenine methylase